MKKLKTIKETTKKTGIELETVLFKDMVSKARKGASNNNMIPLTSMMAIELQDNKLTLITTDSRNYLYVIQDNIPGNDFYAVVIVDTFAALVAKTTSETIHLDLKGNSLEFVGNGKYSIELPEEEGEMIEFPDPRQDVELDVLDDIHLTKINTILNTVKPSLATTMEELCYTGYYCGDSVIATDGEKISCMNVKLWDEPRIIPAQTMDLLSLMTAENIAVEAGEDIVIFSTPDCVVDGRTMKCLEDFDYDGILGALDLEYASTCKVKKSSLLQLLDRISLFVTQKVDNNEVFLTFTDKGIQVSSKASSGVELIKYLESDSFEPFSCTIDIGMLVGEIKSLADDAVEIWYGDENEVSIKFTEGKITKVLSLSAEFEDDEEDIEEDEE